MPADATDTSWCPLGARCECCGDDAPGLTVATVTTGLGVPDHLRHLRQGAAPGHPSSTLDEAAAMQAAEHN